MVWVDKASEELKQLRGRNLAILRSSSLCIIAAKAEEANEMIDELGLGSNSRIDGYNVHRITSGHVFYTGTMKGTKGKITYFITYTTRQGIQTFATQAATLFSLLQPQYAIHIGVCAAIQNQGIELEDVIFGEKAVNYEEGKWHSTADSAPTFAADLLPHAAKGTYMSAFIAAKRNERFKHGDYISGCAVRMDAEHLFQRVQGAALRHVRALDMEASAFFQVCEFVHVHALGVIKGVSDMGDQNKGVGGDQHYVPALRNMARATRLFCESALASSIQTSQEGELGSQLATGYFKNFVEKVIEKLTETSNLVTLDSGATRAIADLLIVLPEKDRIKGYEKLGQTYNKHGLEEIVMKGGQRSTVVRIKGGYLVDFPTTLRSLDGHPDVPGQIELFKSSLHQCIENCGDGEMGKVVSWQEFVTISERENPPA